MKELAYDTPGGLPAWNVVAKTPCTEVGVGQGCVCCVGHLLGAASGLEAFQVKWCPSWEKLELKSYFYN